MNVGIHGIGYYVPENVMTNADLEKMMDTTDEWIRSRTGIEERRIAKDDMDTSDMGALAAQRALENAEISISDIDFILVATTSPDKKTPSSACLVQEKLGARGIPALDINAACSGFIYGMVVAQQFIQTGAYKKILVIGVEKLSKYIDWTDRNTAILFSDGAGAAVIGEVSEGHGILSFELGADGDGWKHLYIDKDQNRGIHMDGKEVFKFAVRQMGGASLRVLEKANIRKEDIDFLVPHQANIRIIEAARERLELPKEKVAVTIQKYGNNSTATIPIALTEAVQEGKVKDGDTLVLVGFGAGLTWGALTMRWGK